MMKYITSLLLIFTAFGVAPAFAADPTEDLVATTVENAAEIGIQVSGNRVRVTGAQGKTLEVFSVTGAKLQSVAIDSNDFTTTLSVPSRGLYVVKVDKKTQVVTIK
jgi:predicted NUDIX family NTP pyrophosphohydrolase